MSETHTHTLQNDAVKRLERSRSDRMLAGVSGGLARYFDIHPAVYRVGFVVLTLLGGAGIVIYIAAALVMPNEGEEDSFATRILRERRDRPWPVIGLGLLAAALAAALSNASLWPHGDAWFLLLILGAAILWITRHGRDLPLEPSADAPTVPVTALAKEDSRRIRRVFKGLVIAFATLVALLILATAALAAAFHVHISSGVGERSYLVTGTQDLRDDYKLGIGKLTLDLSDVSFAASPTTTIKARVDVGELDIILPAGTPVRVNGSAQAGRVEVFGNADEGGDAKLNTEATKPLLILNAHVGAGQVQITRAPGR
jgi:phage shock protein PspC (stress-responsive transcriptional regulator)